ncbi:hypothetical protein BCCH1_43990 [Burkholderia contaminans]|uniref:Uncharacterized protein n=1 Tax=Burkholderia contaminans TaxID=488447 RepID=A0A250LBI4_9BURK|nr:hypothetical protein BCCH1_43990 [Burkholderia contaminans]
MSTGNFVFLMHSMPCVGDGYKRSRLRWSPKPPPVLRDAAEPGAAGSIDMQSDGPPVRIDLAPGNRTVAIYGEPAIVLFD